MGNSHKRGCSHFKLNLNDWDIPFPNVFDNLSMNWEKIFSIGETGMNQLSW